MVITWLGSVDSCAWLQETAVTKVVEINHIFITIFSNAIFIFDPPVLECMFSEHPETFVRYDLRRQLGRCNCEKAQ